MRHLVKFKISNNKLLIELGRYKTDHLPERVDYRMFFVSQIKWRMKPFSFHCSTYFMQGQTLFNQVNEIIPDIEQKSRSQTILVNNWKLG